MKAIGNIECLPNLLKAEDPNWQERLYEQTGVIAILRSQGSVLLSNCGYIDLDTDATYRYVRGEDLTEYCLINSVGELAEYILQMESYQEQLVDRPLGKFTKGELFSAVYAKIICAEENLQRKDGTSHQDWGLSGISKYYHALKHENEIVLHMSLIEYDSVEVWLPEEQNRELQDYLELLVKELNTTTNDIDDIPEYRVWHKKHVHIPQSYNQLNTWLLPGGLFDWLR